MQKRRRKPSSSCCFWSREFSLFPRFSVDGCSLQRKMLHRCRSTTSREFSSRLRVKIILTARGYFPLFLQTPSVDKGFFMSSTNSQVVQKLDMQRYKSAALYLCGSKCREINTHFIFSTYNMWRLNIIRRSRKNMGRLRLELYPRTVVRIGALILLFPVKFTDRESLHSLQTRLLLPPPLLFAK